MSNTENDRLANLEMGTADENYTSTDDATEPDGPPPAKNVMSDDGDYDTPYTRAAKVETGGDTGSEAEEDEQMRDQVLNKPPKDFYGKEGEENKRNKWAIAALVLILLFALVLALGLVFSRDEPSTGKLVQQTSAPTAANVVTFAPTDTPTTKAPTTKSPTPDTGIRVPTAKPTTAPSAPTFGGVVTVSELSCAQLTVSPKVTAGNLGANNFEVYTLNRGKQVCGDTYAGPDPTKPNRNVWTATIGRRDCKLNNFQVGAQDICQDVGARLCTADELAQKAAQGSGCGGDNFLLWTSTSCVNEEDAEGYLMINLSLKNNGTFFKCETDLSVETITRCCGDIFDA